MGCVIDGERCTKCCEAITLPLSRKQLAVHSGYDAKFIRENWKPMSKRIAKKKNPYLFERNPTLLQAKRWHLYRCTALTVNGCGKYENRPPVCQDYPLYGRSGRDGDPEYHPQCTEWVKIEAVEVSL